VLAILPAALAAGPAVDGAWAHAGLSGSDPAANATLGAGPTAVTLTFSEQPEPSLSEIRVLDANGAALQAGGPEPVAGDPLSLAVPVSRLARGVYTVTYRAVSAVDGHATAGAYAFGVRVSPEGVAAEAPTAEADTSWLELVARWALLVGLVALLGAAVAGLAGFGGSAGTDLRLAAGGWFLSVIGLVLLAVAQRRTAGSSLGALLDTPVGDALIWRAVAIAAAGAALLLARRSPRIRRPALAAVALTTLAAMAVHVDAGHAAAGGWPATLTVTAQVAHFAAAGVWFGGLAALLLGIRGEPSAAKAAAVRRFAAVAAGALLVVVATGTLRAVDELSSWGELVSSGYGRAVLAKIALIAAIVALAARNRRRTVPVAASDLEPLRRTSRAELALALGALAVAALLGSLAPAVAGPRAAPQGVSDEGSDFGTTVRVELAAASAEPGPNRFVARVDDYDSGEPVEADRVSLRFIPLDDPGIEETTLELKRGPDGAYVGSGANMAFDGRWGVTLLVERGGDAVEVPLELELPFPEQSVSFLRLPDRAPQYTMQVGSDGYIRITVDPERPGSAEVHVTCYTVFENLAPIEQLVLTATAGDGPTRQQPVRRLSPARFVAEVELEAGGNTIVVVARTSYGVRLRGAFELDVPGE
jgi:copper transport protein